MRENEKIKRDIAYVIKGIGCKKRLKNDFGSREVQSDLSPDDFENNSLGEPEDEFSFE